MISSTPNLGTKSMFKDIRDTHSQEKIKNKEKKEKENKGHFAVMNHSQQVAH
jgi:hypothetical protein